MTAVQTALRALCEWGCADAGALWHPCFRADRQLPLSRGNGRRSDSGGPQSPRIHRRSSASSRFRASAVSACIRCKVVDGRGAERETRHRCRHLAFHKTLQAGTYYVRVDAEEVAQNNYKLSWRSR